jgi:hypothetical protein
MAQILEAGMVICFGISWPVNMQNQLNQRQQKVKSLVFLFFVLLGYICAVCGKIISDNISWVFWFYVVNMIMVSLDIFMYFINRKRDIALYENTDNR